MAVDWAQLAQQLAAQAGVGAMGAVTGTVRKNGNIVVVNGRRYRQPAGTNYLIPIRRTRKISFSEQSMRALLALVSTGARMAGGRKHRGASYPRYIFRRHGRR